MNVDQALQTASDEGGLASDDLMARVLPLFREVLAAHDDGRVAAIEGLDGVAIDDDETWGLSRPPVGPRSATAEIHRVERAVSSAIQVVERGTATQDVGALGFSYEDHGVLDPAVKVEFPGYVVGYRTWEGLVGHRDALADVFVLGLVLASLACGLDLRDPEDMSSFVSSRDDLFQLAPHLNPVVARSIREMTEVDRHRRAQDLRSVVRRLETYRDQPDDFDLADIAGFAEAGAGKRRELVLERMRDRLFDGSRRNRLLYFTPTQQTVDLTATSVPQLLDHRRIRADQLLTWQPSVASALASGKALKLGTYLRFDENPYLAGVLDKIISQAKRDRSEYGFAQLRLVVSFLRWHDLRGVAAEVIDSPLLLLPVELVKKKGVRDTYGLEVTASEAEVNPTLRQRLKDLYDLALPERVELSEEAIADFHRELGAQVQASEPGVSVTLVEQPRIDLIQRQARMRAEVFLRRRASAASRAARKAAAAAGEYSYRRNDFRPRGVQLFLSRVKPSAMPQRVTAGGLEERVRTALATEAPMISRETYALRKGRATGNPYEWEIDLCRLTLGNFNYRRMTLVQDYERLLRSMPEASSFDHVFGVEGKPLDEGVDDLVTSEQFLVVTSDVTQLHAISRSRTGTSYIIQGPPGTGKSQTITNLIADFAARGKRVLFVCEKRAAVDVVHHRLRQSGLDSLCCLIHDSQSDKRAFVMDLKATYEGYLGGDAGALTAAEEDRTVLVGEIDAELDGLHRLTRAMGNEVPGTAVTAVRLLDQMAALRRSTGHDVAEIEPENAELVPDLIAWRTASDAARRLERAFADVGESPRLSDHAIVNLGPVVLGSDRPQRTARAALDRLRSRLADLREQLDRSTVPVDLLEDLGELVRLSETVSGSLRPLGELGQLGLLDPSSSTGRRFDELSVEHDTRRAAAVAADAAAVTWRERPDLATSTKALAAARKREGKAMAGMWPGWRKARRLVAELVTEPPATAVAALEVLVADRQAAFSLAELESEAQAEHGGADLTQLRRMVEAGRRLRTGYPRSVTSAVVRPTEPAMAALIADVSGASPELDALGAAVDELLVDREVLHGGVDEWLDLVDAVDGELDLLPTTLDALRDLADAEPRATRALRVLPLTSDELELASGRAALDRWFAEDRGLARLDGAAVGGRVESIAEHRRELLRANAAVIRERVRTKFLENVRRSGLPAAQLDAQGKEFKKSYSTGRRELEHEFGKVMRYKSIRDLAGGASGSVVADLKPIWLMSPLSVSDTLPLETGLFDVVIYDEASQIPVEEAVPALHRAPQAVVVGDQMQLPPTAFFSSSDAGEDDLVVEEDGDLVTLSLDGTSFLNQCASQMPSVLLAWHYRSRSEALIGFSNAAFYAGELRTVPDRDVVTTKRGEITVKRPEDGKAGADKVLDRPISFHRIDGGVYEDRRNTAEAGYIAETVRALLAKKTGKSIGVVAFSEAQQGAIEDALEALAAKDKAFAAQLEAERDREEEDQFVGLFVKNLENVQGDERDIVVLSICYAPDRNGRMRMNFGPINAADGEKRLNVIFSRAKHHMAVVSSIRYDAITNDWNDGAAALQGFLRYAEASSAGEEDLALTVLDGYLPKVMKDARRAPGAVVAQIAEGLRARKLVVDLDVGASQLRCDVAVRKPRDASYRLAVLVDHRDEPPRPEQERWVDRPGALRATGWQVAHVVPKDWVADPEAVLDRLVAVLEGKVQPPAPAKRPVRPAPSATRLAAAPEVVAEPEPVTVAPTPAPTARPAPAPTADDQQVRRLVFIGGGSAKFWEVHREDSTVHVRFGRLGTNGQAQTKDLGSAEAAQARVRRLIAEKVGKGYVDAAEE